MRSWILLTVFTIWVSIVSQAAELFTYEPLTLQGDLSEQMVAGIDRFLMREIESSLTNRTRHWKRDFSSSEAYVKSVETNRISLRVKIGARDRRIPFDEMEVVSGTRTPAVIAESSAITIRAVRWPVFDDVYGEGLLIQPKGKIQAFVVALPDADQTPEMISGLTTNLPYAKQFARRLAETGCLVLVPTMISRDDEYSVNFHLSHYTNQPHREWLYRQSYEMGRHIIGFEVQKVAAALDWFERQNTNGVSVGVAGYAEGGLIAFYAGAVQIGIRATLVSGYFDSRQNVWSEPIYRNVFGLLAEFGDAEIASLIAPRKLIIEHSEPPQINGPPKSLPGRAGAAPGKIMIPELASVEAEANRANGFVQPLGANVELIYGNEGRTVGPGSDAALLAFCKSLGVQAAFKTSGPTLADPRPGNVPRERQRRQLEEMVNHVQALMRVSEETRNAFFWSKVKTPSAESWNPAQFKEIFWNEVIGRFPKSTLPLHPRARQIHDEAKWTGYDVTLDVWPDVFAWGVLLLPKDLKPGERRPVIVCQHGLEGVPEDTITQDPKASGYPAYKGFASRLAEQGFVVFAPHNPYRGHDKFRVLQRKANLLGKSLFSVILEQHERILDWLGEQPFVDPKRIGFYGLSYGGKTAMRVPSLLDRYALSICSADFNEWIRKNVTVDSNYSYLFTMEYEMPEFNLGNTFNYAEMAALIAPRPFMVERGHNDGVAPDEWVAYEYSKVRRLYDQLGIGDRTEIEFFNGPHTINAVGTFKFLHKHLNWPER